MYNMYTITVYADTNVQYSFTQGARQKNRRRGQTGVPQPERTHPRSGTGIPAASPRVE